MHSISAENLQLVGLCILVLFLVLGTYYQITRKYSSNITRCKHTTILYTDDGEAYEQCNICRKRYFKKYTEFF